MEAAEITPSLLSLASPLTIRRADAIGGALLAAMHDSTVVSLDLPEDGSFDLSFVQVVEAARIHARAQGKHLSLATPASGPLLALLEGTGFLSNPDSSSFWVHSGETQ